LSLLAELQRRKVFKAGAAYLVVAWLAVQAVSIAFPAFDAPPWALRVFILMALLGFPLAVVMAWILDATPDGIKLDPNVSGSKRVYAGAAILIALAVGWYFYGQPSLRKGDVALVAPRPAPAAVAPAVPRKSIAVLAFTDLSPKHDQDYFSDGIAEELLNALAKVKDLKVAGRTSAFYYKGRNEDLRTIGRALGVANVLEGSVRTQGDKVRITAQLIRSADGFHLWSESYDGDLKDVFALQERIARAITDQLQVVLAGPQSERLVNAGTENPEAYSLYLQATSVFNRRDIPHYGDAIAELHQAVALDPKFARAYSRLAVLNVVVASTSTEPLRSLQRRVEENARKASALDPTLAEPYAASGVLEGDFPGGLVAQRQAFEHALALDGDDVTTNFWFGLTLVRTGYGERGLALIDHALDTDPMLPNALRWRGIMTFYAGDTARAEVYLDRARDVGLRFADRNLADIASARGDRAAAIRLFSSGTASMLSDMPPGSIALIAQGIYGDPAARPRAIALLDDAVAERRDHIAGMVPVSLLMLGEPAKALAAQHAHLSGDTTDFLALLWSPRGKAMRDLPEFQPFLRDFGFIELWDKFGPPDICHKNGSGEYACK
jgi:TolB-like protein